MASRIAGVGCVTVSLRRSITRSGTAALLGSFSSADCIRRTRGGLARTSRGVPPGHAAARVGGGSPRPWYCGRAGAATAPLHQEQPFGKTGETLSGGVLDALANLAFRPLA